MTDFACARLPGGGSSTSLPEALWEAYDGSPVIVLLEDVDRVEGLADVVDELTAGYPAAAVLTTAVRPTHVVASASSGCHPLPLPEADAPPDHPALLLSPPGRPSGGAEPTWTTRSSAPTSPASAVRPAGCRERSRWRQLAPPRCRWRSWRGASPEGTASTPPWPGPSTCCRRPRSARCSRCRCSWGRSCSTPRRRWWTRDPPPATRLRTCWSSSTRTWCELDPASARASHGSWSRAGARLRPATARRDRHSTRPCATATRAYFLNRARAGGEVVRRGLARHRRGPGPRAGHTAGSTMPSPPPSPSPRSVQEAPGAVASLQDRIAELLDKGRRGPRPAARPGADVVDQHLPRRRVGGHAALRAVDRPAARRGDGAGPRVR